eukprot:1161579-Pelagomonas_calceolata.AAC.10
MSLNNSQERLGHARKLGFSIQQRLSATHLYSARVDLTGPKHNRDELGSGMCVCAVSRGGARGNDSAGQLTPLHIL